MVTPTISVIIPTYNRASYVRECVQSVLAQTFMSREVIVVDDGSTDNTAEVLAQFNDVPEFRYFYQPNSGRSTARNYGGARARGDFVLFLDSDDLLFPDALAKLYEAAERTSGDMIVGQTQFVDENLNDLWVLKPDIESSQRGVSYAAILWGRYFLLQGSFLLRRRCLNEVGLFERELEPCEDFDFCLRVALHCQVICLESPVLRCRMHRGNTDEAHIYQGGLKVAHKHLRLIEGTGFPAALRRQSKPRLMLRMADNHYGLGHNFEALKFYLRAIRLEPWRALNSRMLRQILASLLPLRLRNKLKSDAVKKALPELPSQREEAVVLSKNNVVPR